MVRIKILTLLTFFMLISAACKQQKSSDQPDLPQVTDEVVSVEKTPTAMNLDSNHVAEQSIAFSDDTVIDTLSVEFDLFSLAFPGLEGHQHETNTSEDTLEVALELGADFADQVVLLRGGSYDSIKLYESYRTTLSIMNEGPHLDLYEWKGHESGWMPLSITDERTFKTRTISEEESKMFPEFTREELTAAADKYSGGRWGQLIRNPIFGEWTESFWIGVGLRRLKIDVYDSGQKQTRILIVWIPMGC